MYMTNRDCLARTCFSLDELNHHNQICTSADDGQTLGGCFHLSYNNLSTECIAHDAAAHTLQSKIEDGLNTETVTGPGPLPYPRDATRDTTVGDRVGSAELWVPGVGRVNVTTNGSVDDMGGRCWNATFSSAIGAVGPMTVSSTSTSASTSAQQSSSGNKLSGLGAAVTVETLQSGNSISGNFSIQFGGEKTAILPSAVSAKAVSEALLELQSVAFARTTRTSPLARCGDGLCSDGQTSGGGLQWTVELGTRVGNAEPSSPTVFVGKSEMGIGGIEEGDFDWPEVVSYLEGDGAMVSVAKGWVGSADQLSASFSVSQPFSIALGGAGASHGKKGAAASIEAHFLQPKRKHDTSRNERDLIVFNPFGD